MMKPVFIFVGKKRKIFQKMWQKLFGGFDKKTGSTYIVLDRSVKTLKTQHFVACASNSNSTNWYFFKNLEKLGRKSIE